MMIEQALMPSQTNTPTLHTGRTRRAVNDDAAWKAVIAHDAAYDGQFVYSVETTGVYCRPSCPSRRPRPEHVSFFDSANAAEHAGFRACLRCRPRDAKAPWVAAIDRARGYIDAHLDEAVSLSRLGRHVGQSSFHLQRMFKRVVGLTPKQYQRLRRTERFKKVRASPTRFMKRVSDRAAGFIPCRTHSSA
jgi:AraC family transcriptional regulator of adaptative response/methylated-DNA-[protein]-cysteine methyltransferase